MLKCAVARIDARGTVRRVRGAASGNRPIWRPTPRGAASRFGARLGREERRRMERPPVAALPPAGEWAGRSGAQSGAGGRW